VRVSGREDGLGRALLYGTTQSFLDRFGLKSPKDLPASLEL
jgi:segregation and condensation protein B